LVLLLLLLLLLESTIMHALQSNVFSLFVKMSSIHSVTVTVCGSNDEKAEWK